MPPRGYSRRRMAPGLLRAQRPGLVPAERPNGHEHPVRGEGVLDGLWQRRERASECGQRRYSGHIRARGWVLLPHDSPRSHPAVCRPSKFCRVCKHLAQCCTYYLDGYVLEYERVRPLVHQRHRHVQQRRHAHADCRSDGDEYHGDGDEYQL